MSITKTREVAACRAVENAFVVRHDQPDVLAFMLLVKAPGLSGLGGRHLAHIECHQPKARPWLERAVANAPNDYSALNDYGWRLAELGRFGEAQNALEKAVQLAPATYDPPANNLNRLQQLRGKRAIVLKQAPEARELTNLTNKRKYLILRVLSSGIGWWSRQESNLRPSHCERDALPTELRPQPI